MCTPYLIIHSYSNLPIINNLGIPTKDLQWNELLDLSFNQNSWYFDTTHE